MESFIPETSFTPDPDLLDKEFCTLLILKWDETPEQLGRVQIILHAGGK